MTSFIRKCPKCDCELTYKSKYSLINANKKNSKCKSCGLKEIMTDDYRKKISERLKGENNPMFGKFGKLNPFFGKKHTEETKKKMIDGRDYSVYRTEEFRQKISKLSKGKNNPMYGKTVYDVWIEKYGKKIADEKMIEYKKKQSLNSSGEKNAMYGKPAPINAGNGICGWYKGWFFRSLLELSYMIFVIERFNFDWESGESVKYKISYSIDGKNKNYFPDFVLNKKYIIECKPKKLTQINTNKIKFEFAKKYCEENGFIFKIRDIPKIKKENLIEMVNNELVVLTNKWKDKLKL
jgi:hypothetical protein